MVGEITLKDDKCKHCPLASFNVRTLYSDNTPIFHAVICEHEDACRRIEYILETEKEAQ